MCTQAHNNMNQNKKKRREKKETRGTLLITELCVFVLLTSKIVFTKILSAYDKNFDHLTVFECAFERKHETAD